MRTWAAGLRAATKGNDNAHVVAMVELIATTACEVADGAEWLADLAAETESGDGGDDT